MLLRTFVRAVIHGVVITHHEPEAPCGLMLPAELCDAADLDGLEEVRVEPADGTTAPILSMLLVHSRDTVVACGALAQRLPVGTTVAVTARCLLDREELPDHRARIVRAASNRPLAVRDLTVTAELEE